METEEREATVWETVVPHSAERERTGARRERAVEGANAKTIV